MNRLLWATISGLLLGAVLFGMLQRGCDATGSIEEEPEVSRRSADFITGAPVSRSRGERIDPYRAENPTYNASRSSRAARDFSDQTARRAMQQRARDRAQALAEARRAQREAAQDRSSVQQRTNSRAFATPDARVQRDRPGRRPTQREMRDQRDPRADTGEVGVGGDIAEAGSGPEDRGASRAEVDAARSAFQSSLGGRENSQFGDRGDDRRRSEPGRSGNGNDGDRTSGVDASSPAQANDAQPLATAGIARTPLGGGGVFPGGGGDGAPGDGAGGDDGTGGDGPAPPPPAAPGEDTGTDRGNLDTGSGDDEGPPPPPSSPAVETRWIEAPVAARSCPDLDAFRTNDLYLSFRDPSLALVVTSDPALGGLRVSGGRFHQDVSGFGSNAPPQDSVVQFSPCVAQDSFLTLGGQEPSFPPGAAPDPQDWGGVLNAVWFTLDGAVGQIDPSRFGDDRFYVWIGRFTAGGPELSVSGALLVNYINLETGANSAEFVPVLDCASCWEGATGSDQNGEIVSMELSPETIAGGGSGVGTVRLREPASIGGVRVQLTTNSPEIVSLPASITVASGESEASFSFSTEVVESAATAEIMAVSGESSVSATLDIVPLGIVSLTFNPQTTPQGRPVTGTVRLTGSAPSGGVRIELLSQNQLVAPSPAGRLTIDPGRSSGTFTVTPGIVRSETEVTFIAFYEGDSSNFVTGSFIVTPVIGDLTGDGLVGAADQAQLLGSWGPCPPAPQPCPADLNGDGVVNAADLAILLGNWTQSPPDDGGPDDPPDDPTGALARWIPVDNSDCPLLGDHRTGDLYLGFNEPGRVVLIESNDVDGIRIENGSFRQNNPGGNGPPPEGLEDEPDLPPEFICWLFDSYLTIEGVRPPSSVSFAVAPPANNWGSTLIATWFVFAGGAGAETLQDPVFFGDNRHYVRIGRFTAEQSATIFGAVTAFFQPQATGEVSGIRYEVPDWSLARGALDINGDGQVDSGDLGLLMQMLGTSNPAGDLNGDGMVTMSDVRLFLESISSVESD
ncbi:MAG: hypothetical protein EA376_03295 [Phycisphaeraceae bacterium]|nr:MAG: hypothetical protein EA376_03295 [Phycisphaeraceae bacterium]